MLDVDLVFLGLNESLGCVILDYCDLVFLGIDSLFTLKHFCLDLLALSGFEKNSNSKELLIADSDNSSVVLPEMSTFLKNSNL